MHSETESLRRIVKARARELKLERRGYLETVRVVVDELLDGARGKQSRIYVMGAVGPVEMLAIVKTVATILGLALDAWKAWQAGKETQRVERERLERKVAPWISEVFEERDARNTAT